MDEQRGSQAGRRLYQHRRSHATASQLPKAVEVFYGPHTAPTTINQAHLAKEADSLQQIIG